MYILAMALTKVTERMILWSLFLLTSQENIGKKQKDTSEDSFLLFSIIFIITGEWSFQYGKERNLNIGTISLDQ